MKIPPFTGRQTGRCEAGSRGRMMWRGQRQRGWSQDRSRSCWVPAGMYFSIGIVLIYGFSVFIVPIAGTPAGTGLHRAPSSHRSPSSNGLMSPLVGALTDQVRAAPGAHRIVRIDGHRPDPGSASHRTDLRSLQSLPVAVASLLAALPRPAFPIPTCVVGWFSARRGLALWASCSPSSGSG